MNVPFYGHTRQYKSIQKEIDANIRTVLESGQYVHGADAQAIRGGARGVHPERSMRLASVTARTQSGSRSWRSGVRPGDEVITHSETPSSRPRRPSGLRGPKAVLVDCDEKTRCIDPAKVAAAITPKTKAIIPVHSTGSAPHAGELKKLADKHKLLVIRKTTRRRSTRAGDDFRIGELSDRRHHELHHPEEPRDVRRRRGSLHGQREHRCHGPQAAQPRLGPARPSQLRL